MSKKYILDGKTPKECPDLLEWALWIKQCDPIVAQAVQGGGKVSTVFLGMDYQRGSGPPLLFETAVIGGQHAGDQARYSTWEQAEAGHAAMCAKVLGAGEARGND